MSFNCQFCYQQNWRFVLIHTREKIALFFRKTNVFFRIAYFLKKTKKDTVFLKKTPFLEITQFFFSKKLQSNKAEKSMFLQKLCFFTKQCVFFSRADEDSIRSQKYIVLHFTSKMMIKNMSFHRHNNVSLKTSLIRFLKKFQSFQKIKVHKIIKFMIFAQVFPNKCG